MRKIRLMSALLSILFIAGLTSIASAQEMKEIKISTSMSCNDCKAKIEKELNGTSGISSATADLASNIVTIKYDAGKMDQEKIMASIKKLGYKAELSNSQVPATKSNCASKCGEKKQEGCCGKK